MDFENIPSLKIIEKKTINSVKESTDEKKEISDDLSISNIRSIDSYLSKEFIANYFIPSKK